MQIEKMTDTKNFGVGEWKMRNGEKATIISDKWHDGYLSGRMYGGYGPHIWFDDGVWGGINKDFDLISPWQSYQYEGKEMDMNMSDEFKHPADEILDIMHPKPSHQSKEAYIAAVNAAFPNTPETETLRDKTFRAALTGLLASGHWPCVDEVVIQAYAIADEAMKQRSE